LFSQQIGCLSNSYYIVVEKTNIILRMKFFLFFFAFVSISNTLFSQDIEGCMLEGALNYNSNAVIQKYNQWGGLECVFESCSDVPFDGCSYPDFGSFFPFYNEYAELENCMQFGGTICSVTSGSQLGCTDTLAINYSKYATDSDNSCDYIMNYSNGCTDSLALNFSPYSTVDSGDCITDGLCNEIDGIHVYAFDQNDIYNFQNCNISGLTIQGNVFDISTIKGEDIRHIDIYGSYINSNQINDLINKQSSIETFRLRNNISVSSLFINNLSDINTIDLLNNTGLLNLDLNVASIGTLQINMNENLSSIQGFGFDIIEFLHINGNASLTSISGSSLSDSYNQFNWSDPSSIQMEGNPNLNSCCPLGGFSNFLLDQFEISDNGESCSDSYAIKDFFSANCLTGCTDTSAINYDGNATIDDGSCEFCPDIQVISSVSDISCITNDADIALTVYPSGLYGFEWSDGQTSSTIFDVPYGDYSVTVTNPDGCETTKNITLNKPLEIIVNADVIDDDLGQCNGEIITTITGGTGGYTFQWFDNNNQTTQNASNLCSGNYLFEVTDNSGCSVTASFEVGGGIPWTYDVTGSNHSLFVQEETVFSLFNSEIEFGDYIGAFYVDESTGELKCGGYMVWEESQVVIPVWGDDPDTPEKDGFYENELIILAVYNNSENREYFGKSIYFENFPNSEYFTTNGFSSLKEFNGLQSPDWQVGNTGVNHSILLTEFHPYIGEDPLVYGDFIGIFFIDDNDELRCGGKTMWTGTINGISAWGDDPLTPEKEGFYQGDDFIWRVWKSTEQESFSTTPTYSENYSTNYSINGLSVLYYLDINSNQSISLPKGWSMFSVNVRLDDYNVQNVFDPIETSISIIKDYNGIAYLPDWEFNGIGELNNSEGYQIKLDSAKTLSLSGAYIRPESHPIALPAGWSMISYLLNEPVSVNILLNDLKENNNLLIAKNYLGLAYLPEWGYNGIGDFVNGQGYQIKLNEIDTLIYKSEMTNIDAVK